MTSPLANVTARMATIHARVAAMSSRPASGTVGTAGPARRGGSDGSFAAQMAAATRPSATAPARTVEVTQPDPAAAGGGAGAWAKRLPAHGQPWADQIQQAADQAGIDAELLASVVWTESGFDPQARSHAGAVGLTQLMPATADGLGVDPTDPADNLAGGATFLKAQLDRFGSVQLALAAYNAGPSRVAQAGGIPNIPETQAYVPSVLGHLSHLKGAA